MEDPVELTEVTVDFLMACALHPSTWDAWVPQEIMVAVYEHIPSTVSFSISCLPNGLWILADKKYNVLLSSGPVKILPSEAPPETAANNSNLFQALLDSMKSVTPMPPDRPPKRTA